MPTPFLGMDPYLEKDGLWPDLHSRMLTNMAGQLEPQVGTDLVVRVETQLYLQELSAEERRLVGRADVAVLATEDRRAPAGGVATLPAPYTLSFPGVVETVVRWLEIRDRQQRRAITVVELLSPSNKRGADREAYMTKRRNLLLGGANFVEIDLLRGGKRLPLPDGAPESPYYVLARRAEDGPHAGYWPFGLRDPLPRIPVPLRDADAIAWIDLRRALDDAYDAANYRKDAYLQPPDPPLDPADAAWAKELLGTTT